MLKAGTIEDQTHRLPACIIDERRFSEHNKGVPVKTTASWIDEAVRLYSRATVMWTHGQKSKGQCFVLEGRIFLQAALWDLYRLINGWVTPKIAVGPSARRAHATNSQVADEIRRRVASLPPLPANWHPDNLLQQVLYRKLQKT